MGVGVAGLHPSACVRGRTVWGVTVGRAKCASGRHFGLRCGGFWVEFAGGVEWLVMGVVEARFDGPKKSLQTTCFQTDWELVEGVNRAT
jgi:hypothetical protein